MITAQQARERQKPIFEAKAQPILKALAPIIEQEIERAIEYGRYQHIVLYQSLPMSATSIMPASLQHEYMIGEQRIDASLLSPYTSFGQIMLYLEKYLEEYGYIITEGRYSAYDDSKTWFIEWGHKEITNDNS